MPFYGKQPGVIGDPKSEKKIKTCLDCGSTQIFSQGRCKKHSALIMAKLSRIVDGVNDETTILKKKLDDLFSLWIRQKDMDKDGMVKCYTSGRFYHWTELDAGHFISRRFLSTRWEEMNVKPQSIGQNRFKDGNPERFRKNLINEYGEDAVLKLEQRKNMKVKFNRFIYNSLIAEVEEKLIALKAENQLVRIK